MLWYVCAFNLVVSTFERLVWDLVIDIQMKSHCELIGSLGRGTHPVFEEKFVFEFTEGVVELNIWVLANKPTRNDEVIGSLR